MQIPVEFPNTDTCTQDLFCCWQLDWESQGQIWSIMSMPRKNNGMTLPSEGLAELPNHQFEVCSTASELVLTQSTIVGNSNIEDHRRQSNHEGSLSLRQQHLAQPWHPRAPRAIFGLVCQRLRKNCRHAILCD
eukprot:3534191-Amphidinium_carterae.1